MRVLMAKQRTAYNNGDNISAVLLHNPRIMPILAISSQISAGSGSTCSIERRNTQSSGSVIVQNPKYCEDTRSKGSIEQCYTAGMSCTSSIGHWNAAITRCVSSIAGRKYLRCSSQCTWISEDTGSIESIYFSAASTRTAWEYKRPNKVLPT